MSDDCVENIKLKSLVGIIEKHYLEKFEFVDLVPDVFHDGAKECLKRLRDFVKDNEDMDCKTFLEKWMWKTLIPNNDELKLKDDFQTWLAGFTTITSDLVVKAHHLLLG